MRTRTAIAGLMLFLIAAPSWAAEGRASAAVLPPTGSLTEPLNAFPRPTYASATLDELAQRYTTPKTIAAFLRQEFTFRRDQDIFSTEEYWQTPEEFLARRIGDCEDYALLARELLVRNGIEAHVFSLFGDEGYAHTVCVYVDEEGRYNILNQDKLRRYRAKSLEALASQMYPAWTFGGVTEQAGVRGRLLYEITNPHPVPALASSFDPPPMF